MSKATIASAPPSPLSRRSAAQSSRCGQTVIATLAVAWMAAMTPHSALSQMITYTDYDSPKVYSHWFHPAPFNGIRFTQTTPWVHDPADPFDTTLVLLESPDYTDTSVPDWSGWENMKWLSGTTPVPTPVATYGFDESTVSPFPQSITARTISLENVAWDVQNVRVFLRGTDGTLSLENSSVDLQGLPSVSSRLFGTSATINAVAGTSNTISHISGPVASAGVGVNVPTGATLRFLNSGSLSQGAPPNDQVYFSSGGNQFDVNGGTLLIEGSSLRVEQGGTGSFQVRNGGSLTLDVANSRLDVLQGSLDVDSSSLTLNPNTELTIDGSLNTTNATVSLFQGARIVTEGIGVSGDTVLTAFEQVDPNPLGGGVHAAGVLLSDASASLTVRGTGTRQAGLYIEDTGGTGAAMVLSGGSLELEHALLAVNDIVGVTTGGAVNIDSLSTLRIAHTGEFGKISDLAIANEGLILVEGRFSGNGTITSVSEDASFEVSLLGKVDILGNATHSLEVQSGVLFDYLSSASLLLNPALGVSQHMDVGGTLVISRFGTELDLVLENDAIMPYGSKLMLFDYPDTAGRPGYFENLPDGTIFDLGLNTYRIAYFDPQWDPTNASVITLTVVPEPSSLVIAGWGVALIGSRFRRRRRARRIR